MGCAGTRPRKSFDDDEGAALAIGSGLADAPEDGDASAIATGAELAMLAGDVDVVGAFLQLAVVSAQKKARRRIEITFRDYTPRHLELRGLAVLENSRRAEVAEWQTQRIQNPPSLRVCGFKSHLRYKSRDFQSQNQKNSAENVGSTSKKPRAIRPVPF
jgi:hypothetical protein